MKNKNLILLLISSPFLLGIFYFVFGIGIVSSAILSLGLTTSSIFLLDGLSLWQLWRLTKVGVQKIKKEIQALEVELELNNEYLEEFKEFFTIGSISKQSTKKVTDALIFKSLFTNTNIEKKVYKIEQDINDLFSLFNDKYVNTDNLSNKKEVVEQIRKMNDAKRDLHLLLKKVKENILSGMKKNLASVIEVRNALQKEKDRLGNKSPLYLQTNIDTLSLSIKDLEEKIKKFGL